MGKIYCPRFSSDWGSMMLIESMGEFLLIDTYCAGNAHPRAVVKEILAGRKANLCNTHGHKDHNGDAGWYLYQDMISRYYCSMYAPYQESSKDLDRHNAILAKCKVKDIPIVKIRTGSTFTIGGAKITCMFAGDRYSNNAKSLCLLIEMDGCKILNCGDATEWTLNQLVLQGYDLSDIDIWMFNHHGVPENNPAWWINKIKPTIAISNCCGESNSTYRSWAKNVYTRCENAQVNCYSTQYNGDLVFECIGGLVFPSVERNGQTMTRNGRTVTFNKAAKKYWRGNFTRRNRLPRDFAVEVMLQMWGRNPDRSEKIRAGGYDPDEVQAYVNLYARDETELLWAMADYVWQGFAGSGTQRKNILAQPGKYDYYDKVQEYVKLVDDIAQQVLAGRYGQNPDRAIALAAAGYKPAIIQNRVNQTYGSSARS